MSEVILRKEGETPRFRIQQPHHIRTPIVFKGIQLFFQGLLNCWYAGDDGTTVPSCTPSTCPSAPMPYTGKMIYSRSFPNQHNTAFSATSAPALSSHILVAQSARKEQAASQEPSPSVPGAVGRAGAEDPQPLVLPTEPKTTYQGHHPAHS